MKLCVTAKVHVLELWNNNMKQLEDNMLKSDTQFVLIWKYQMATLPWENIL